MKTGTSSYLRSGLEKSGFWDGVDFDGLDLLIFLAGCSFFLQPNCKIE
ncbi:MAG: hypothetical protein PF689_11775 [Deltaproteobacteria bacterium]|nr:hypothetical protein [Deltaproteobacteria bacterium]